MVAVSGADQTVAQDHIGELSVAKAIAPAGFGIQQIRRLAHIFHTACDNRLCLSGLNRLCGKRHAFEAGAAYFVNGKAADRLCEAAFEQCLTRRVLPKTSL